MITRVLNDNVLVKITELPNITASGIILTSSELPCIGVVLGIGPGKVLPDGSREQHGIQIGDEVIFGTSALNNLVEDTKDLFIMKAEQIYGKKDV